MLSIIMDIISKGFLFFALHIKNGSSFPPALSAKEEKEYLKKYREGDMQAKNIIIEHNLRLVAHIIKKYYSNSNEQDDLISIGTIGLIKAVNTFDENKGIKLATYASKCIENTILTLTGQFLNVKKHRVQEEQVGILTLIPQTMFISFAKLTERKSGMHRCISTALNLYLHTDFRRQQNSINSTQNTKTYLMCRTSFVGAVTIWD